MVQRNHSEKKAKTSKQLTQSDKKKSDKKALEEKKILEQENALKEEIKNDETQILKMQKSLEEAQASLKEHKEKLEALEKKSTVTKEVIPLKLQSPTHQKIETKKADEA